MSDKKNIAIEIMTEEDRLEVIPFLESLGGKDSLYLNGDIHIGCIYCIDGNGEVLAYGGEYEVSQDQTFLKDYTILKGVPKDWREESEPNYICSECGTEQKYIELVKADNGHDYSNYCKKCGELIESNGKYYGLTKTTPEPPEPSRIDQLESENKELRELLKNIVGCTRQSGNGRNRLNDNKLGVFHIAIQKAKQLLEK